MKYKLVLSFISCIDWLASLLKNDRGKSLLQRYHLKWEMEKRLPSTLNLGSIIVFMVGPFLGIKSGMRGEKRFTTS